MVNFRLGETVIDFRGFAKHHKRMPLHIGRTSPTGEFENLITDAQLKKDVNANPSAVFTRVNHVFHNNKIEDVIDQYVWFQNDEYMEPNIVNYSIGAMNTSQETFVRYVFQFEESLTYLDYSFTSSGTFASSFYDAVLNTSLDTILEEITQANKSLEECGIQCKEEESIYTIVVVSDGAIVDIDVSLRELEQALIGIEIYDFKQTIHEEEIK